MMRPIMASHQGMVRIAKHRIHWKATPPAKKGRASFLWLGGFASDMTGTKAEALARWARKTDRHLLRFDYSAHGKSEGDFSKATLGQWLKETLYILEHHAPNPVIIIGSSMGAWLALLAARARKKHVAALFLIAPAPDFTEKLIDQNLSAPQKKALRQKGSIAASDAPQPIYASFIEEARQHLLLSQTLTLPCPVRILHGLKDEVVPRQHVLELIAKISSPDLQVRFLKEGDHRLSTPKMLRTLLYEVERLSLESESQSASKPSR